MYFTFIFGQRLAHSHKIKKVLIANRGEIAVRIIQTARRLGIETIAVYSDVDSNAQHVQLADRAYRIGEAASLSSYLNGRKIVEVARRAGAQAIHPGYGFLSENAEFAEECFNGGIKFVGPSTEAIRAMGQKNRAKEIMIAASVPTLPGYNGTDQADSTLLSEAQKIGFPVMIKPVYGGGGKGMRITHSAADFSDALASARSESNKSFGNAEMIIEKFVEDPRHVEVQIFGDSHGNFVHLWERDCSIQRRHQKIIEEAPAPGLSEEIRQQLGGRAVDAARAVNYEGAGTVEFIMDKESGEFFFMEMNTRLQVEHPVTESITGVDLVEWQFKVADGGRIPLKQSEIPLNGFAIEARIYAEDFDKDSMQFMPTAGKLEYLKFPTLSASAKLSPTDQHPKPEMENVRVDAGIVQGDEVTVHYDPMIAKIIAWGPSRVAAISRLNRALGLTFIGGVCSNISLVRSCLAHEDFVEGRVSTGFVDLHKTELFDALTPPVTREAVCEAVVSEILLKTFNDKREAKFNLLDFFRVNHSARRHISLNEENAVDVEILDGAKGIYRVMSGKSTNGAKLDVWMANVSVKNVTVTSDGGQPLAVEFVLVFDDSFEIIGEASDDNSRSWKCKAIQLNNSILVWSGLDNVGGVLREWPIGRAENRMKDSDLDAATAMLDGRVEARSPIPGVVEKIFVQVGERVKKAQALAVMNAMKMEFVIKAPCDCTVKSVECHVKDTVCKNAVLLKMETADK